MLAATDLTVHYGHSQRGRRPGNGSATVGTHSGGTIALDQVSLEVAPGERFGVFGISGAGKSTLARCIAGLQTPNAGHLAADGQQLSRRGGAAQRRFRLTVQMVYQNPYASLPPHLPVRVPLRDAARLRHRRGGRDAAVTATLKELGLDPGLARRRPSELSGGQRQRIAIARALLPNPEYLVLDEITSALDPITRHRVLASLGSYQATHGTGLILISHDMPSLLQFCTHLAVLHKGRIVEAGRPEELLRSAEHPMTQQLVDALPALVRSRMQQGMQGAQRDTRSEARDIRTI